MLILTKKIILENNSNNSSVGKEEQKCWEFHEIKFFCLIVFLCFLRDC